MREYKIFAARMHEKENNTSQQQQQSNIDYKNSIITNYLQHGFGKYTWTFTGDKYVAKLHHGNMQGKGTFTWGSNGRKLMNIPFDEHPYSALAAWFQTDEGLEVFNNLEKRLK